MLSGAVFTLINASMLAASELKIPDDCFVRLCCLWPCGILRSGESIDPAIEIPTGTGPGSSFALDCIGLQVARGFPEPESECYGS